MLIQTIIGGLVAIILFLYMNYRETKDKLYIGKKIYYYLCDEQKKYSGKIMAIIIFNREEDITPSESHLRVIPLADKKIRKTQSIMYEIQPIIGGSRIVLPEANIYKEKSEVL